MGRTIPSSVRMRIRKEAGDRCGYCLSMLTLVFASLEIEHIIPVAKGGTNEVENLWLACRMCNLYKGSRERGIDPITGKSVKLFNPRFQKWTRHFRWDDDGIRIIGRTTSGRATVVALQLNNIIAVTVRREWVYAGWHPPKL